MLPVTLCRTPTTRVNLMKRFGLWRRRLAAPPAGWASCSDSEWLALLPMPRSAIELDVAEELAWFEEEEEESWNGKACDLLVRLSIKEMYACDVLRLWTTRTCDNSIRERVGEEKDEKKTDL